MKRHQTILAVAAAAICLSTAHARPTFEVREVELNAFERHDEVLLTLTKPMYRLGEILKTDDGRWVVPMNYFFEKGEWHYLVCEVKVGKKK